MAAILGFCGSLVSAAALVAVAIIETRNARDRKRVEERARKRELESELSMELMSANCDLTIEAVMALQTGHTNGTLESRLKRAVAAQERYNKFLQKTAAHAVTET